MRSRMDGSHSWLTYVYKSDMVTYWWRVLTDPIENLTEGQKVCLRFVAQGMTSKEIAQASGLSPQTIDTYLKAAMARLGVATRRDAARLLARHEISQQLGPPSATLERPELVSEAQATITYRTWVKAIAPPPIGGKLNDLSATQRTIAVLKVAAFSAAILLAITIVLAGILLTFRQ